MKNLRKSLLVLFALLAFGPTAWAQFSGGSGTETDPYQISSTADWNTLADNVSNGTNTYSGQFFKMTTDIGPVTKMVGSSKDNCFQGTFDGDGHTLTVNYNTSVAVTAPFRYVDNATFKRLRVSGVVKSSERYVGGIVSMAYGDINFISCRSSVNLEVNQKDNGNGGYIGGFVAYVVKGHFNFVNCLFDGKIKIKDFQWIGGIVGFIYNPLYNPISGNVVNCFFNPESCDAGGANCASTLVCHLNYDEYDDIYTISNRAFLKIHKILCIKQ